MSFTGTRLVGLADLGERDLAAWRELSDAAVIPNPYWHPEFVLPASAALGERGVALLIVLEGGEWTACLPVRHHSGWHRIPLPCISSWRHRYCLLGTPLLASQTSLRSGELSAAMFAGGGSATFAALDWIDSEGAAGDAIAAPARGEHVFERFSRPLLRRRPEPNYLEGRIHGKHRRDLHRLATRLEAELGDALKIVDRSDSRGVEAFLKLEASGWKGRTGTALASESSHADFFREMTSAFAARGALELLFLEAGRTAVAARCNLLAGDASFGFKVAYDERFKRYSPGRELELRELERFHEESGLAYVDSCTAPDSELYGRLWPDRRELITIVRPAAGPLGVLARSAVRGAAALRERRNRPGA